MKNTDKIFAALTNCKSWCFAGIFLFCGVHGFSQDDATGIQQQFQTYTNSNFQEKVFLHTDKTVYATGEVLWFKAYITKVTDNNFSSLSSICYVEIFSSDNKPLLQGKVDINAGSGNGSFVLPPFIRTGNYVIRAFTNWMKNFDPSFYFEQPITIINPGKKGQAPDRLNEAVYSIQFFPEGGNMVYGLDNTLAFKIADAYGKGVQGKGVIVNDNNDTIIAFQAEHFGMGTFSFIPVKGNRYHAVVHIDNKSIIRDLPEIYENGWILHVKDEGNSLSVAVKSNIESAGEVFLIAQTRQLPGFAKMQPLTNGNAAFSIDKSSIGEGITQLTVFNDKKQPVCERLYFKRPATSMQVKLNNLKKDFHPRQKVDLSVLTNDTNGEAVDANMSATVYLTDSLQPEQKINLLNYLWLSSDLKGTIESPEYYFENTGAEAGKAADNLMLTQGWRRFKWEDVLKNTAPSFAYLPEHEGHIITGKLTPKISGLPDTGVHVYLSVPGKNFKFSPTVSTVSGYIRFNVEKFYGSHELIVRASPADSNYRIFIDKPFFENYPEKKFQPLLLQPALTNEILTRSIGAQAENTYQPEKKENFVLPPLYDTTGFAGIPSRTYYLDNYTRFPTMEEVMREYVKEVHVRIRQKSFHYEVFNEPAINYFSVEPLVMIDGVRVFDVDKIILLDPLKIKKVDVITNRVYLGKQQYDGVVSYATYNDDLDGFTLDPNALVIEYEGLQLKREFYSPQYETDKQASSRLPDYRNVLYWAPDLKTPGGKKDISFYTADVPGKYIVLVQGISSKGLAGFATADFTISP
ncbi:MAG: hypothetical protein ABI416_18525 [Ginsengibacter sp.]